jgi:hypothetical protein
VPYYVYVNDLIGKQCSRNSKHNSERAYCKSKQGYLLVSLTVEGVQLQKSSLATSDMPARPDTITAHCVAPRDHTGLLVRSILGYTFGCGGFGAAGERDGPET